MMLLQSYSHSPRAHLRVILFVLLSIGWIVPSLRATGNPWYDAFVTYDNSVGGRFVSPTDNYLDDVAFLAWNESYIQRGYLNLYEVSQDTAWLTKFVTHFDYSMSKAADVDGDGYDEWTTSRYSTNPVANAAFETADSGDSTLPADWQRSGSTATTALLTAPETSGSGACATTTRRAQLVTAGATLQRLFQDLPDGRAGHPYELTFRARNGGSVDARVFIYNRTTNTVLVSVFASSSSWKRYRGSSFAMPADGDDVEVWLSHEATTGSGDSVYFDDIRIAPRFSYHVLDGMIGVPAARFVRLVDENPTGLASFQSKADTYQDFLEDHVVAKWHDSSGFYGDTWTSESGTDEGYYSEPDPSQVDTFASSADFDPLPHNQYLAMLQVQDILHAVNSNSTYRTRADEGARNFETKLSLQGTAYRWNYGEHTGSKIEDNSHGNVDLEFVTELHRDADIFAGVDMERFTDTLTDWLWDQNVSAPQLHNLVNGTKGSYCSDFRFTRDMYGWIPLAQFDPLVWYLGAAQYDAVAPVGHSEGLALSEIIKWDPVKLTNQGFELPDSGDATLPARWERFQSTAATAYRDSSSAQRGDYGLTLVSNGTKWQKLLQPWTDYAGGGSYEVSFHGKTDSAGADGRVWIFNDTTGTTIASYNIYTTAWTAHSFSFVAPANGTDEVSILLGHRDYTVTNGHMHFDNVVIKRTGDAW